MIGRDVSFKERRENIREPYPLYVQFDLETIKSYFDEDINSIESMFDLEIDETKKQFIYQSQIVLLSSAFDFYLHNITKYGVNRIHDRIWKMTKKYENQTISFKLLEEILNNDIEDDWFYGYISDYYEKVTMMSYESLKDQMNLIGIPHQKVADLAFYQKGDTLSTKVKLKNKIDTLFQKRNIIAHQTVRSHRDASKEKFDEKEVKEMIDDIKKIVDAIHQLVTEKS